MPWCHELARREMIPRKSFTLLYASRRGDLAIE